MKRVRRPGKTRAKAPPILLSLTLGIVSVVALAQSDAPSREAAGHNPSLTAVPGIKVGHFTLEARPTGCTVVLAEGGAVAGVDVRGGAPATRETDLLDPANLVQEVQAVALSGGSAFGLDAASGVVRYLEERKVGFPVNTGVVPIVVGASLFDLAVGGKPAVRPGPNCGYRAAQRASTSAVTEGNVGAGAGASVGKFAGMERAMKAGVGSAGLRTADGLIVAALVAVNALGDVIDPATGEVVAGVRTSDGAALADVRKLLRNGAASGAGEPLTNTTIGVVATNARLSQAEATALARMAQTGLTRAIVPAHTPADGDTIFALATGTFAGDVPLTILGALGAEIVAEAVVRAARSAEGLPGLPAATDLGAATGDR